MCLAQTGTAWRTEGLSGTKLNHTVNFRNDVSINAMELLFYLVFFNIWQNIPFDFQGWQTYYHLILLPDGSTSSAYWTRREKHFLRSNNKPPSWEALLETHQALLLFFQGTRTRVTCSGYLWQSLCWYGCTHYLEAWGWTFSSRAYWPSPPGQWKASRWTLSVPRSWWEEVTFVAGACSHLPSDMQLPPPVPSVCCLLKATLQWFCKAQTDCIISYSNNHWLQTNESLPMTFLEA